MKLIIHSVLVIILSSVALVLPAGCGHEPDGRLLHAEDIIENHPDSALDLLEHIDMSEYRDNADKALYGLLLTMAMDKCHLEPDNDTLISRAVEYYEKSKDNGRLIKATYYRGRVQYHKNNNPLSIVDFFRAKELAENSDEYFWAGMSCRGIADIYADTYNASEELNYARKEYEYIKKDGRQPFLNYALYDLGVAMHNNNRIEESVDICIQLCDSAIKYDDSNLLLMAERLRILSLTAACRYVEAYPISKKIISSGMAEQSDSIDYCEILMETGELKQAGIILENLAMMDSPMTYWLNYRFAKYNGNTDTALDKIEVVDSIINAEIRKRMSHDLTSSLTNYLNLQNRLNKTELTLSRLNNNIIIAASFLLMLTILMIVRSIVKRKNQEIEERILFAQRLRDELQNSKQENSHSYTLIKSLLSSRYEMIDEFCYIVMQNNDSAKARKKIADYVTTMIDELSVSSVRINELENQVDKIHGNLFSDFRNDLPDMKEMDYRLFLFCVLGLSNDTMSLLLKERNKTAVYNRKNRLKRKIRSLDCSNKEKYLKYL